MSTEYLNKIAIVGAGGQFGKFITRALIAQGKHSITAITRADSTAKIPKGVNDIRKVDYASHDSLVEALKEHDALIITMKATADPTAQEKLIDAAKDAGIRWIMPNEYGYDPANNMPPTEAPSRLSQSILAVRKQIEAAGMCWVGLSCGFWYEFSLAGTEARYGFDFKRKALTLFDDGKTKISTSTWPQAALAVAKTFALPIQSRSKSLALSDFENRAIFVDSFSVSQRDMLASVLRVTGDAETDWTITSEPSKPRYERGVKMMSEGDFEGFVIFLYARVFFPDGGFDFTSKLNNKDLDLPEESMDDATKTALEMAKVSNGHWSMHW